MGTRERMCVTTDVVHGRGTARCVISRWPALCGVMCGARLARCPLWTPTVSPNGIVRCQHDVTTYMILHSQPAGQGQRVTTTTYGGLCTQEATFQALRTKGGTFHCRVGQNKLTSAWFGHVSTFSIFRLLALRGQWQAKNRKSLQMCPTEVVTCFFCPTRQWNAPPLVRKA